ncbi:CobW family GTP-binding protein [Variovorax sp. PAMC 28711]|uniref:CobW family GTP-binding protein n=1 Tax=Variovorax sp. PAMC 28711 TaxID=1795631 RepID=UPI00078C47CC|nr:CobW family GTP-binding protein [Variovorax sp. PAMC 28711]AMM24931.1 hypothetical protein AX767_11590 [Variovorax sp. PAMC 28711]
MTAGRIPLLVIGGFLGSGKTTLLQDMLQNNDGSRLAVLVNDFGAVNIDAALVRSRGADMVNLANGCVCCQTGGDLTDALIRVIERTPRPDAIVIEASGVSDPWRIAQVGLADPALALDGVVVVVDAASVRAHADDPLLADTVQRQLRAADLLVLNQCDRVDGPALQAVRDWLDAQLPGTPRFETSFGRVPAALLGGPLPAPTPGHDGASACGPHCTAHDHGHPPHHDHGEVFDSWSTTGDGPYDADALRALLRAMPPGVLRMKGMLRTTTQGWAVLQFAGRHGSLRPWPTGQPLPADDVPNAIVAIGLRGRLPVPLLAQALAAACDAQAVGA